MSKSGAHSAVIAPHPAKKRLDIRPGWFLWRAFLLVFALILTCWPIPTTFDASVVTESFTIKAVGEKSHWYLHSAGLAEDFQTSQPFDGAFEPAIGTKVQFERIGYGPLLIECNAVKPQDSAGMLFDSEDQLLRKSARRVVFRIENIQARSDSGETVVLPFKGSIQIGRTVGREPSAIVPMLRSGKVRMLGRSFFSGIRFDSGDVDLERGDEFSVSDPKSSASGVLVVDESPGATVIARLVDRTGVVQRFGAEGYNIGTSTAERLRNDTLVQIAWASFLFFLGLPAALKWAKE